MTDYHQTWVKDTFTAVTSEFASKEELLQSRLDRLKERLVSRFKEMSAREADKHLDNKKQCKLFNYNQEENLMYSFVQVSN